MSCRSHSDCLIIDVIYGSCYVKKPLIESLRLWKSCVSHWVGWCCSACTPSTPTSASSSASASASTGSLFHPGSSLLRVQRAALRRSKNSKHGNCFDQEQGTAIVVTVDVANYLAHYNCSFSVIHNWYSLYMRCEWFKLSKFRSCKKSPHWCVKFDLKWPRLYMYTT